VLTQTRSSGIKPFKSTSPGPKPKFAPKGKKGDGFRVNREIFAPEVRVIGPEGQVLGVLTVPQALQRAQDFGLDLIEIAPTASPPTCKIMDYGKWKYENKKKQNQARKNQVIIETKEVQVRPRTDQHDLDTKIRHSRRFLLDGDKVKVNLRFSGREMAHQEEGVTILHKFKEALLDIGLVELEPKKEGRQVFMILAPDPVKIKEFLKKNPQQAAPSSTAKDPEAE